MVTSMEYRQFVNEATYEIQLQEEYIQEMEARIAKSVEAIEDMKVVSDGWFRKMKETELEEDKRREEEG